jgi:hypothetical protein
MGATSWNYFTPFEHDAAVALQRLRERVFGEGRYEWDGVTEDDLKYFNEVPGIVDPDAPLEKQMKKQEGETYHQFIVRFQNLSDRLAGKRVKPDADLPKRPETIDKLLEMQGESGTHSIIDIERIALEPDFGSVTPMPVERLLKLFRTDKPTRRMVEEALERHDIWEDPLVSERWQGVFFTIYRDNKPDELLFIGTSGD